MKPLKTPTEDLPPLLEGGGWSSVGGTYVGVADAAVKSIGGNDVAVLVADGIAAGVVTSSTACAAPCQWSRRLLPGRIRALVVNSGNANAATGAQGVADTRSMAETVAEVLACDPLEVLVASTGVIGVPLPVDRLLSAVNRATNNLTATGADAARAIMTTDLTPKEAAVRVNGVTCGGMAKGSGMIHPNMATMLAFVAIDARVEARLLQEITQRVCDRTFNAISVDGDTSTNDMLTVHSVGKGALVRPGSVQAVDVEQALYAVCRSLARAIAADGEGASHLIECVVEGLPEPEARRAARAVIASPLVKTAVHGRDANWGRVVSALGAAGVQNLQHLDLDFAGVPVLRQGTPLVVDEEQAKRAMNPFEVLIHVRLPGRGMGRAWGCDLTADYVRINADYRS